MKLQMQLEFKRKNNKYMHGQIEVAKAINIKNILKSSTKIRGNIY